MIIRSSRSISILIVFLLVLIGTSVSACSGTQVEWGVKGAVGSGNRAKDPRQSDSPELTCQDKTGEPEYEKKANGTEKEPKTLQKNSVSNEQKKRIP